jgi:hypothetical protein
MLSELTRLELLKSHSFPKANLKISRWEKRDGKLTLGSVHSRRIIVRRSLIRVNVAAWHIIAVWHALCQCGFNKGGGGIMAPLRDK